MSKNEKLIEMMEAKAAALALIQIIQEADANRVQLIIPMESGKVAVIGIGIGDNVGDAHLTALSSITLRPPTEIDRAENFEIAIKNTTGRDQ